MLTPQCTPHLGPSLFPDPFRRVGFQRHDEHRQGHLRRVGDEQVCVVLVRLELVQSRFVPGAHLLERGPEQVRHTVGHHFLPVFRGQHNVGVQSVDHVPPGSPFVLCHAGYRNRRPCCYCDRVSHRYRMDPKAVQVETMVLHCAHSRFVWNLALEQRGFWRRGMSSLSGYDQKRDLTEARGWSDWLRAGSSVVQQQAVLDLDQAFKNWWGGSHRRPTWRRVGVNEGFAIRDLVVRRLNRKWATVAVPKLGPVRFRLSRPLPEGTKSARVTLDTAGRWHVSFTAVPPMVAGPGTGTACGIDRGVANTITLDNGEIGHIPQPTSTVRLQRKLARQKKGSNRRARTRHRIAVVKARDADRRKDWVEKTTTDLARRYDTVVLEDLRIRQMMRSASGTVEAPGTNVAQKRGLNRSISVQCWGLFARRLGHKIGDRLVLVPAAFTSQRCYECGHTATGNRESQAVFRCQSCGHGANADVNAARNIAAGHAVTGRGGKPEIGAPVKRQPPSVETRLARVS